MMRGKVTTTTPVLTLLQLLQAAGQRCKPFGGRRRGGAGEGEGIIGLGMGWGG